MISIYEGYPEYSGKHWHKVVGTVYHRTIQYIDSVYDPKGDQNGWKSFCQESIKIPGFILNACDKPVAGVKEKKRCEQYAGIVKQRNRPLWNNPVACDLLSQMVDYNADAGNTLNFLGL